MGHIVARMQKMKAGNLGGAYRHNERVLKTIQTRILIPISHISTGMGWPRETEGCLTRLKLRTTWTKIKFHNGQSEKMPSSVMNGLSRQIRLLKTLVQKKQENFWNCQNYFAQNYGEQNIAYPSVHLDESTLTCTWVLCQCVTANCPLRLCLTVKSWCLKFKTIYQSTWEQGFEIERGARNSEAKHLTVAEFKQEMAYKEIESELVVDYGAPQFMNTNTGEFMTRKKSKSSKHWQAVRR